MSVHFIPLRIRKNGFYSAAGSAAPLAHFGSCQGSVFSMTLVTKRAIPCFRIRLFKDGTIAVTYANDCALVTQCNQLVSHVGRQSSDGWPVIKM